MRVRLFHCFLGLFLLFFWGELTVEGESASSRAGKKSNFQFINRKKSLRKASERKKAEIFFRKGKASSRPAVGLASSRPMASSRPAVKLASSRPMASSRPAVKLASSMPMALSRPAVKIASSRPTVVKIPKSLRYRGEGEIGWLSLVFGEGERVFLDGVFMGMGVIPYLRVPAGRHRVVAIDGKLGKRELVFEMLADRHTAVSRRGKRYLGYYRVRGERSNVLIRYYGKRWGRAPRQEVRAPGRFCWGEWRCLFLFPGEELYLGERGESLVVPSSLGLKNALSFRFGRGDGFLTLFSFPPGALFIDGELFSMAPVSRLPLRPGRHRVFIRNNFLGMAASGSVFIQSGQEVRRHFYLVPEEGGSLVVLSSRPAQIFVDGYFRGYSPLFSFPLSVGEHWVVLRLGGYSLRRRVKIVRGRVSFLNWRADGRR